MSRPRVPAWLPNALTVLRVTLIPAFVVHAHWCAESVAAGDGDRPHRWLALAALLGIGVSDVVDGWLARSFGLATNLGAVLDAVADKLAQVSLLVFFALADGVAFLQVPLWFVALLLGRDALLGVGALLIRRRRGAVRVIHEVHGKASSLLLFALLVWLTADLPRGPVLPTMVVLAGIVVLSTWAYARDGWRQWTEPARD